MHTVFTGNTQNRQKVPKIVFWPIFQEVPPYIGPPIASRWLEVRVFPLWGILRGETPHFLGQSKNLRSDILEIRVVAGGFFGGGVPPKFQKPVFIPKRLHGSVENNFGPLFWTKYKGKILGGYIPQDFGPGGKCPPPIKAGSDFHYLSTL